jgi:RNA polymerase sigma-70 factor (ECF subfamily)
LTLARSFVIVDPVTTLPKSAGEGTESASGERRPDELLVLARAAAGRDATAASTLLSQVGGIVLATVRQVLGPGHPDVEDVAQEAAIAFLGSLGEFRGECSTRRYAQRVALFTALTSRRRLVAQERLIDPEQPMEAKPAGPEASPLVETLAARRRHMLRKVLDSLPDVIAQALALHFILGHTVDEIAEATSSPPNTIWSRLRLGKQALRRILSENADLRELFEVDK